MTGFLRWFAAYRDLERRLAEAGERAIVLQDRVNQQEAVISELRGLLASSREELISILKEKPEPVANVTPQTLPPYAIHARDFVRLKTDEYFKQQQELQQAAQRLVDQATNVQ